MTAQEPEPVVPVGGAGLFDVDPAQNDISQDPDVAVSGDLVAFPEDEDL